MSKIIFEVERFLRWLATLTADEKREHSAEISEASQAMADTLESLSDGVDEDDVPDDDL
jgi:hypothetical protein